MLHLLDMENVSIDTVLPFLARNMDQQGNDELFKRLLIISKSKDKLLLMILINLINETNHPAANLIEQRNLLLPLMAEVSNEEAVSR